MTKFIAYLKLVPLALLALPMLFAGGAKLLGVADMHASFAMMGLPLWFGYFIGGAELIAGIALFVPRLAAPAAVGLIPIMLGAVYFHLSYQIPSAVPAVVFIVLSLYVIAIRRDAALTPRAVLGSR